MHLRCPHCLNPIEVADLPSGGEVTCLGCGSSFQLDPFPVVRNQMMSASPAWTGELPVPSGMALAADMTTRRLQDREALRLRLGAENVSAAGSGYDLHRRRAIDLIQSPEAQKAFELSQEPARVRGRFPRSSDRRR